MRSNESMSDLMLFEIKFQQVKSNFMFFSNMQFIGIPFLQVFSKSMTIFDVKFKIFCLLRPILDIPSF